MVKSEQTAISVIPLLPALNFKHHLIVTAELNHNTEKQSRASKSNLQHIN